MRLKFFSHGRENSEGVRARDLTLPKARGRSAIEAMKIEKQREIVIEFERVQIVRKKARTNLHYCPACRREADFVSLCQAASLFSVDAADLFAFIKRHRSHFQPDDAGMIFVCLVSLLAAIRENKNCAGVKMLGE